MQLSLLSHACRRRGGGGDFGLKEFAPGLPLAGWTGKHDAELLQAVYEHGVEAGPSAAVQAESSLVGALVARALDSEAGAARDARRQDIVHKVGKRVAECLRRLPGAAAGAGGGGKVRVKRARRPAEVGGGGGGSEEELSDFQPDKRRCRGGGGSVEGGGQRAAGVSPAKNLDSPAKKWEPRTFQDPVTRGEIVLVLLE